MTMDPNEPLFGSHAMGGSSESGELASPALRFGELLLTIVLAVVTLGIGYVIWSLLIWGDGQNPAKKILGMKVVSATTGQTLDFQGMLIRSFAIGFVGYGIIGFVLRLIFWPLGLVFTLVDGLMIFNGTKRQRLLDVIAKTQVVMV